MSPHDTPRVEPHQASATHALIIEEASDLVLQACGLGSAQSSDQFSQIQQGESTPRRRGRTPQVSWTQLWSSLLLCALQGMHSFADWRRLLGWQSIGPFTPVWLTRNGLVKRLLQTGLVPLQERWEVVNARLAHIGSQTVPATLAACAPKIFCLDETRLDAVGSDESQLDSTIELPHQRSYLPFTGKLCRILPKGLPLDERHVDASLLGSRLSACRVACQVLLTCGTRNKAGLES